MVFILRIINLLLILASANPILSGPSFASASSSDGQNVRINGHAKRSVLKPMKAVRFSPTRGRGAAEIKGTMPFPRSLFATERDVCSPGKLPCLINGSLSHDYFTLKRLFPPSLRISLPYI